MGQLKAKNWRTMKLMMNLLAWPAQPSHTIIYSNEVNAIDIWGDNLVSQVCKIGGL